MRNLINHEDFDLSPFKRIVGLKKYPELLKKMAILFFRQYEYARKDTLIQHFESHKLDFSIGTRICDYRMVTTQVVHNEKNLEKMYKDYFNNVGNTMHNYRSQLSRKSRIF